MVAYAKSWILSPNYFQGFILRIHRCNYRRHHVFKVGGANITTLKMIYVHDQRAIPVEGDRCTRPWQRLLEPTIMTIFCEIFNTPRYW